MPTTTHARSSALAKVSALVLEADANGHISIPVAALWVALDGVDVEGLANPRPSTICNVGDRHITTTRASAHDGEQVAWS